MAMLVEPLALRGAARRLQRWPRRRAGPGGARGARDRRRARRAGDPAPRGVGARASGSTAETTGTSATRTVPRVDRESHTVQFEPTVVDDFDAIGPGVAKIVGVSDDYDAVAAAAAQHHRRARRPRLRGDVAALLPRHHAPSGEQGRRRLVPVRAVRDPAGGHRDDRGRPERRPHVRPLGPLDRDGERAPRRPAGRPPRHDVERGGRVRERRRAVHPAEGAEPMATDTPMQLGMVGLGRMGGGIVRRLMRDGHTLRRLRHPPGRGQGARGGRRGRRVVARGVRGEAREAACRLGDGARRRHHRQDDRGARARCSSPAT